MARNRHEWIAKLAAKSSAIGEMKLESDLDDAALDTDAFNLANCDAHCDVIVRAIDELLRNGSSSKKQTRSLLRRLIARETYGAFAELSAYDWLIRCHAQFVTQVDMTPSEVLGTKGSTLDGKIEWGSTYFDVKAFGSNGRLAQQLQEKLQAVFPNEQVLVGSSWDLSFESFSKLLASASDVAKQLRTTHFFQKGRLRIYLKAKQQVTVSSRRVEPYRLAKENALFPFVDAKQFTRNHPFILILVVHPWFNAGSISSDFAGVDTIFTRSLARRAFMQFSADSTRLDSVAKHVPADVTLADASQLLSAIFFINVWPKEADPTITYVMPSWLYLNPRAIHRLTHASLALFRSSNPQGTIIDDFADDDY
jgi:hypothetical protein